MHNNPTGKDAIHADRGRRNLKLERVYRELYDLTAFRPKLRAPLVQSLFISLQQPIGRNLALELSGLGSRGRRKAKSRAAQIRRGLGPT